MSRSRIGLGALLVAGGAALGCREPSASAQAAPAASAREEAVCGRPPLRLQPPDPPETAPPDAAASQPSRGAAIFARWHTSNIHREPDRSSVVIGFARRGHRVPVRGPAPGPAAGCPAGLWYALRDGGYACASRSFRLEPGRPSSRIPVAAHRPLPFDYAKVDRDGAPRLARLPTRAERARLERGESVPGVSDKRAEGAYFITVVDDVEHQGHRYVRTTRGDYLRAEDVEPVVPPRTRGEHLGGPEALPLAFVHREDAPVSCRCDGAWKPCGVAERYARFTVAETAVRDGAELLGIPGGGFVPRSAVRIARQVERPGEVPEGERWIHVDLAEQTLVAYEGDRPVLATLVSTGREGFETPQGIWQIERMHVGTTMSGDDPESGSYRVAEVPWTMYYDGPYALHGAYWHEGFGEVRSHGCTNIPPADARWLFAWSGGVPEGWHAASHRRGPWVWVTDSAARTARRDGP